MELKKRILDNGLSLIGEVNASAKSAAIGFFVKTGSRDETEQTNGVSHYLEHMLFKGTEKLSALEVNEAFAAQYLAVEKELGLDRARTNVEGGAVALGHPLGASGARITVHLLHTLRRIGKRYGLGTACIGGGQGIAVIVEALG